MAQSLNLRCFLVLLIPLCANAEALRDPTMPPPQFLSDTTVVSQEKSMELQSVMIGAHHKAAMINGQVVHVGQKYQDKLLLRVTEQAAFLSLADGTKQVLRMEFPVEKKSSTETKSDKSRKYARPNKSSEKAPMNAKG